MSDGGFYRAFEDLHRGSHELIQSRLGVYLPFVRGVAQLHGDAVVTDLGCGRGEWLELLRNNGVAAQGVDLDADMLEACRALGLDVHQGDALECLKQLPDNSQSVVSGFHIAEHLPFEVLQALVTEALRVLRPGGLLILETPNPENLAVGTSGFYMDPTHERPLPPPLLAFLPEFHGFGRVKILRLQHGAALDEPENPVTLQDVLAGVSPDYAVIAQKPIENASQPALDAAFSREHGVSLNELSQRHERQWAARVHQVHVEAAGARNLALAAQAANAQSMDQVSGLMSELVSALAQKVLDQVSRLEHKVLGQMSTLEQKTLDQVAELDRKVVDQLSALQHELWASRQQLSAMHQSTSWRVTAPMRWVGGQLKALRAQGPGVRARRMARTLAGGTARAAIRVLERYPRARQLTIAAIRAAGLGGFAERMRARFGTAATQVAGAPETQALSPRAQRIHEALRRSVDAHAPTAESASERNP
jgi:SAM-dependent methyltransferase